MVEEKPDGRGGVALGQPEIDPGEAILRTAGVRLPDDLCEEFEDLATDDMTLRAKYVNFCTVIHAEQKAIVARSRMLWEEVMSTLRLKGKWRYKDGKVYPVDEPRAK